MVTRYGPVLDAGTPQPGDRLHDEHARGWFKPTACMWV
jgi:hypothetical protein